MKVLMPGSYDPCTVGHLAVIRAAAERFREVTVAVFINPKKEGLFSYAERVEFLRLATADLPRVTVAFSDGMVADFAKDGGYDYFCTTLSISPHKNAAALNAIGGELSKKYGVPYLFSDFKKNGGYLRSCELSKEYGLYRQNYCGCQASARRAPGGEKATV